MILDTIAASTRKRVKLAKRRVPPAQVQEQALRLVTSQAAQDTQASSAPAAGGGNPFKAALSRPGLSFICEVKRASPSKGLIWQGPSSASPFDFAAEEFPYLKIAQEYEAAGASAVSVLTEPEYFLGSDDYLREIAREVKIPALRKDFVIDEYQIYEAKLLGASAVLLICALLDVDILEAYLGVCRELGLSALVETHSEAEVEAALKASADIIGINNRDLTTFAVDVTLTKRIRRLIPMGKLAVAESGVRGPDDIRALGNVDAVLIGECMMLAPDKRRYLEALREAAY